MQLTIIIKRRKSDEHSYGLNQTPYRKGCAGQIGKKDMTEADWQQRQQNRAGNETSQERPLFSVIVTTFNRPALLRDALASLTSQTFQAFEVILVNDHGAPVESLLVDFPLPITYLRQGRNQGPAAARNAAIRIAKGHYITYLDDDDRYLPDHLHTLADAIGTAPEAIVYTDSVLIIEKLDNDQRIELARKHPYVHGDFCRERMHIANYIPVNTFACPAALIHEAGGFDEQLKGLEDWDLLLSLAARADLHHIHKETVEVRVRPARVDPHRRSEQASSLLPVLYKELYARHGDLNSEVVRNEQQKILDRIEAIHAGDVVNWLQARTLQPAQRKLVDARLEACRHKPSFAILVLDLDDEPAALASTLNSLERARDQYPNIQPVVLTVNDTVHLSCTRLEVSPGDWLADANQWALHMEADWLCLIRAGDLLTPNGLLMVALQLLDAPECRALYCDELYRLEDGTLAPALRPDFNLDYMLSMPAGLGRHWLFSRAALQQAGSFNSEFQGAAELELVLRLIIDGGLDGLGHVAEPLLICQPPLLCDIEDEKRAILDHLRARGYEQAEVLSSPPGHYHLQYHHTQRPRVSILICAGTRLAHLQRCIESLLENTRHGDFELLLVAQDICPPDIRAWLFSLAELGLNQLRIIQAGPASQAQALNLAALQATGSYLLLLSAQSAIISADWLEQLLNHAQRPEVGIVGACLARPDGTLAHSGLVLGLHGVAASAFADEPMDAAGYMQRLRVDQNYHAVSKDCLMIARDLWQSLAGLAPDLAEHFLDIDLCLRAGQAGFLTVWAANAKLMLSSTEISEPTTEERDRLYQRWLTALAHDQTLNPGFTRSQTGFVLAPKDLSWRPLASWRPLPVVLAHPSPARNSAYHRIAQPISELHQVGLIDGVCCNALPNLPDLQRLAPDSIVLQQRPDTQWLADVTQLKRYSRAFKVLDLDRHLPALAQQVPGELAREALLKLLRPTLDQVDRLVVATESLAELFDGAHRDIRIVQNRLCADTWKDLQCEQRDGGTPRVGIIFNKHCNHDQLLLSELIPALANKVDWVFVGDCPRELRHYARDIQPTGAIEAYPITLARLQLDLALLPLAATEPNNHGGNLSLLEIGACGYPVICTDIRGLSEGLLPATRVGHHLAGWLDAIGMHLADPAASQLSGRELQASVRRDWLLEGAHLQSWSAAWLAG
ncbi:glycosyltransferase [Pseudomonas sp. NPDC089401]|uniref:glycosyltransferase n=1 Tax=Pseudomonas sp. NPDC089401 TaxID=3364462 RepID=UPI0038171979